MEKIKYEFYEAFIKYSVFEPINTSFNKDFKTVLFRLNINKLFGITSNEYKIDVLEMVNTKNEFRKMVESFLKDNNINCHSILNKNSEESGELIDFRFIEVEVELPVNSDVMKLEKMFNYKNKFNEKLLSIADNFIAANHTEESYIDYVELRNLSLGF